MGFSVVVVVALLITTVSAGTKLGVAHNGGNPSVLITNKASWYYTWNMNPVTGTTRQFVPMLWGSINNHPSQFLAAYNAGKFNKSTHILGFNEPDHPQQANMNVAQAVTLWRSHLQPLAGKFKLGAPAITSDRTGKPWLQNFINSCTGCSISFIPIHWYGSDVAAFKAYVTDIWNTFRKPIWVTEFACVKYGNSPTCTQEYVYDFMGQTTQFLDSQSYVERFSWFGVRVPGIPEEDALLTRDGNALSPLGGQYINIGGHA